MADPDARNPTQAAIDSCTSWSVSSARDLARLFGSDGFIGWFNSNLAGTETFRHRGPIPPSSAAGFDKFWDLVAIAFSSSPVTVFEFCALTAVSIQETAGALGAMPEECNPGPPHAHPELAYYFDRIGQKHSYNTLASMGNVTVAALLDRPEFMAAHGSMAGAALVGTPPVDKAWAGEIWPQAQVADARTGKLRLRFPTTADERVNGFLMQTDFHKFRGRGIVQTTGRSGYRRVVEYVVKEGTLRELAALGPIVKRWTEPFKAPYGVKALDGIASLSNDKEWNVVFDVPAVLAFALADDSRTSGHYLVLSHDAPVANGDKGTPHSLRHMVGRINGSDEYARKVPPMMNALINQVAHLVVAARPPRRQSRMLASDHPSAARQPTASRPAEVPEIDVRVEAFCKDMSSTATDLLATAAERARAANAGQPRSRGREKIVVTPVIVFAPGRSASSGYRTPEQQAMEVAGNHSWVCWGAHMTGKARDVVMTVNGKVSYAPVKVFSKCMADFKSAWGAAMLKHGLKNWKAGDGWSPGDEFHLELPDARMPVTDERADACLKEYVRLTHGGGGMAPNVKFERQYASLLKPYLEDAKRPKRG